MISTQYQPCKSWFGSMSNHPKVVISATINTDQMPLQICNNSYNIALHQLSIITIACTQSPGMPKHFNAGGWMKYGFWSGFICPTILVPAASANLQFAWRWRHCDRDDWTGFTRSFPTSQRIGSCSWWRVFMSKHDKAITRIPNA